VFAIPRTLGTMAHERPKNVTRGAVAAQPATRRNRVPNVPSIDEIADSLYGLPPEQFTAARTQYEKEAKAAGDRDAAARIHAMAKPSVPAWLANQLAREHRDELQPLLELGAGLRNATRNLAGDQLRTLSRQQHQLVYALVEQARKLARAADRSVSDDAARGLEETLHAALADEQAASLLLAGRLTNALHSSGLDSALADTADTADTATNVIPLHRKDSRSSSENSAGRRQPREQERGRAEQDLIEAERALADATAALNNAQGLAAAADQAAATAQERIDELRQHLDEATSAASDADRRREEHKRALRRAELAVRTAERQSVGAHDRRDRIAADDSGDD